MDNLNRAVALGLSVPSIGKLAKLVEFARLYSDARTYRGFALALNARLGAC